MCSVKNGRPSDKREKQGETSSLLLTPAPRCGTPGPATNPDERKGHDFKGGGSTEALPPKRRKQGAVGRKRTESTLNSVLLRVPRYGGKELREIVHLLGPDGLAWMGSDSKGEKEEKKSRELCSRPLSTHVRKKKTKNGPGWGKRGPHDITVKKKTHGGGKKNVSVFSHPLSREQGSRYHHTVKQRSRETATARLEARQSATKKEKEKTARDAPDPKQKKREGGGQQEKQFLQKGAGGEGMGNGKEKRAEAELKRCVLQGTAKKRG